MAITHLGRGAYAAVSNGNLTIQPPAQANYAVGDLLLIFCNFRTTARGFNVPSGWTELFTWDPSHRVFAKIATVNPEPAVVVLLQAGSSSGATIMANMASFRTNNPVGWPSNLATICTGFALRSSASESNMVLPAFTVPGSGTQMVMGVAHKYDDVTPPPAPLPADTLFVAYNNSTLGDDAGYLWTYRTAEAGTNLPEHSFVFAGSPAFPTYSARFAITDFSSAPLAAPVANFTATPLAGYPGQSVAFTDSSTNFPSSWLWDFGDGGSSTQQNPSRVYAAAGTYTVTLTATNSTGSDSETKTGYVVISPVPPDLPSPSEVLNIGTAPGENHFSVQVAPNGAGSIATHTLAEIEAGYEESPYFYTTPDGLRVHFEARMDGPTTSGSSYTRSELRELNEAGANIIFNPFDGGVHWIRSKFTIKHQPPVKPEIVFMQLHDGDADRIAIRTQTIGAVNMVVCRVNGSAQTPRLANPSALDVEYEAMIRLHSGNGVDQVTCEVYFNDMVTPIIVTTALAPSTHPAGWYFKVGLYNQSNQGIDDPNEYGAVEHRNLAHWHTGWAEPANVPSIPTVDTARAADFFAVM